MIWKSGIIRLRMACVAIIIQSIFLFSIPAYAATSIPFTVNMSEAVNVTGTPRIAVDVGGVTRYATYTSGTGTSTLTFTYTMVAGDLDLDGVTLTSPLDLNGGTLKDLNGNDATLTFTVPNTSNVKVSYPSLSMDFVADSDGQYTLNGTTYSTLPSFLTAAGGTFTRASIATYFDSAGTIQTAASGSPRFDYDPVTHVARGILIEEARTNAFLQSSAFQTANWTKSTTTISADAATAPDGTNTADKFSLNSASAFQWMGQTITKPSSTSLSDTFSFYAKMVERRYILVGIANPGYTPNAITCIDLQSGTATAVTYNGAGFSAGTASIASVGNGWYRISLTATTDTAATLIGIIEHADSVATNWSNSTGTIGHGIYVWGAQLEQAKFPTSYIPTTTATVTRQADIVTIPTGTWYNQSAGGFYNNVSWVSSSGASYPMFFRVDDTTSNNRWNTFYNQSGNSIGVDGYMSAVSQGAWSTAASTSGSAKIASAQSLNSANTAFNGTLKTLDASWTPPTVTRLILDGYNASKWHSQIKYYPLRVADPQLPLLTQ